jgi:TetR/AcrR family transcriptional repressor of nem operon
MKLTNTAADILGCARSLIISSGYNGFSYADIAKVVGVRNATIHHHFPTKAELVRMLVADYRREAQLGLAELGRHVPEPGAQLRAYVGYWQACIADGSAPFCICALLAAQIPDLPEEVALEVRGHFRTLATWLADVLGRGAAAGTIRLGSAAEVEAQAFMATVHGAMLSARALDDGMMFSLITEPLLARLLD